MAVGGSEGMAVTANVFFPGKRPFDAAGVDREAQLRVNLSRKRSGVDLAVGREALLDEGHHLRRELVGPLRSASAGEQAGQPLAHEGALGLIEGRS